MHLKNFSLIHDEGKVALSPAYDLLNSPMVLANATEEMALPLKGKKSNFNHDLFFSYFGEKRLGLNKTVLSNIEEEIAAAIPGWKQLIEISYLSNDKNEEYLNIINHRKEAIGWG